MIISKFSYYPEPETPLGINLFFNIKSGDDEETVVIPFDSKIIEKS